MSMWMQWQIASASMRLHWTWVMRLVVVCVVTTLWLLVGGQWFLGNYRSAQTEASAVTMQMIILQDVAPNAVETAKQQMRSLSFVKSVNELSEEAVWSSIAGVVDEGEDLRSIVALPKVLQISFVPEDVNGRHLMDYASQLSTTYSNICSDVVWPKKLVASLDARRESLIATGVVTGVLSFVLYLLLMIQVFRSHVLIHQKGFMSHASAGASTRWIVLPNLLVLSFGVIVGGGIATCAVLLIREQVRTPWTLLIDNSELVIAAAVLASATILVGTVQNVVGAQRYGRMRRLR